MSIIAEWKLEGFSGQIYTFDVYSINSDLPSNGGIYIYYRSAAKTREAQAHIKYYILVRRNVLVIEYLKNIKSGMMQ